MELFRSCASFDYDGQSRIGDVGRRHRLRVSVGGTDRGYRWVAQVQDFAGLREIKISAGRAR